MTVTTIKNVTNYDNCHKFVTYAIVIVTTLHDIKKNIENSERIISYNITTV